MQKLDKKRQIKWLSKLLRKKFAIDPALPISISKKKWSGLQFFRLDREPCCNYIRIVECDAKTGLYLNVKGVALWIVIYHA